MATKQKELEQGVDASTLLLGSMETDRLELDARGAMQITQFRVDTKTKYYNKTTGLGGILKFDGFDMATKQRVKYRTTSLVVLSTFEEFKKVVGTVPQEDENKNIWQIFKMPINIKGFEKIESDTVGHNPYIKTIL